MTALLTTSQLAAIKKAARDACWRAGDLSWMLDEGRPSGPQRRFYERSRDGKFKTFVTEAARRTGKTYGHAIIAVELALKNPGARLNWCQETAKSIRDHAVPLFEKICRDAPAECKGEFKSQRGVFEFPNGAYIYFFGANTKEDADRARGGDDPIASFVDEAGFADWLEYVYGSLLKPAMKRVARKGHYGMTFLVSSTPYTPSHFFCQIADVNAIRGSYCKETIYESAAPQQYIAEEAEDRGLTVEAFVATTYFKREFLCERVVDETMVVFPEFHQHREKIVKPWTRPVGFERYVEKRVSIDLGMSDKTGILYGYVDFANAKIVIEDEQLLDKPNTETIAQTVKAREAVLWPDAHEKRTDRVVDDPQGRTVLDLWQLYKLRTERATKQDRQASIGLIRTYITNGTLVIHPRCVNLQKQLLEALNTANLKDFKRDENGHQDLAASLMYLVRSVSLTHNPYPPDFDSLTGRELPANHVLMMRRESLGIKSGGGIADALLGGNKFVQKLNQRKPTKLDQLSKYLPKK